MDTIFLSKPLNLYFQDISQDFMANKRFSFKIIKRRKYADLNKIGYDLRFEGSYKIPNSDNKSLMSAKDMRFFHRFEIPELFNISMNHTPYQNNGLELTLKKSIDAFRLRISTIFLNRLSKIPHFSNISIGYKQNPHKLRLAYQKMQETYHEIELNYLMTPQFHPFHHIDLGVTLNLKEKNLFDLSYYEVFAKGILKKYQFLMALTSGKANPGYKKLSPGNLALAFKKTSDNNTFDIILEHNLQEKSTVLTACYESNLEDVIVLKKMVNSNYQVSASLIYKVNEYLKIMHSSSINVKGFFNNGEKYKLGIGVVLEI